MDMVWECKICNIKIVVNENNFPVHCRCGYTGKIDEAKIATEENKPLPSKMRMAVNFTKATIRDIKHGFKRITKEQYDARMKICGKPCDYVIIIDKAPRRCTHRSCGCFLNKKAWRRSEDCPMGYWEKLGDE